MEGPLETFETPKQDKMISLIAWLIIASLLFYLAVFTFESFLRKSPWFAVTQDLSGSEQTEYTLVQGEEAISEPSFEEPTVEEVNAFESLDSLDTEQGRDSVNFEQETPIVQSSQVREEIVDTSIGLPEVMADTSLKSPITNVVEPVRVAAEIVEEIASPITYSQVKLNTTFKSRAQAFQYLKEIDFGDLDLTLELINKQGGFHVFVGEPKTSSELNRLEKYLRVRNHGLGIGRISESDREVLFQETTPQVVRSVVSKSISNEGSRPIGPVPDFETEARMKPFTIQVGSFLSRRNAVLLQERMMDKGQSSKVEEKFQGGTYHYRVLVGNFSTRKEATNQATNLSETDDVPVYVRTAR